MFCAKSCLSSLKEKLDTSGIMFFPYFPERDERINTVHIIHSYINFTIWLLNESNKQDKKS